MDSASALLATLLDATHECIKLLDRDGRILFVNRQGAANMELSAPGDLQGQRWADRWPGAARTRVEEALESARRGAVSRFTASRPGLDGEPRWWDVTITPTRNNGDDALRFLTIARETTAEVTERQRAEAISGEMRHRLKNALTIAAGIVTMTARGRPEVQIFAAEVTARFGQVAAIQDLLLDPGREKRLVDMMPLLSSAYGGAVLIRFGAVPDVRLGDNTMQALALAFGELATNSLKYGALSRGQPIDVSGSVYEATLQLEWQEPTAFGVPRAGAQGLDLIKRLVAASGGRVERAFAGDLYVVQLWLPILR